MLRWKIVVALGLAIVAFGLGWGYAQQRTTAATLTALDYAEIQQLYADYTFAYDLGDKDGHDYAAVYVPDGMLVFVRPAPASAPCPPMAGWDAADINAIRGTLADRKNLKVCVSTMTGSERLANLSRDFKNNNGWTARHVNSSLRITPTPEGANGSVYLNQFTVAPKPPTWSGSGVYDDTLVKTASGWRFKRRVITQDAVLAGRPN